jgi:hypothetical protein
LAAEGVSYTTDVGYRQAAMVHPKNKCGKGPVGHPGSNSFDLGGNANTSTTDGKISHHESKNLPLTPLHLCKWLYLWFWFVYIVSL